MPLEPYATAWAFLAYNGRSHPALPLPTFAFEPSVNENPVSDPPSVSVPARGDADAPLEAALRQWREHLLERRDPAGHWVGALSPSALSTATAVSALVTVLRSGATAPGETAALRGLVSGGLKYLAANQRPDGGFGDTDRSHSNIATSYLALAAWHLATEVLAEGASGTEAGPRNPASENPPDPALARRVEAYIARAGGLDGLRRRYGKDKTFVVPIMTNCAIAGIVPWRDVPRLPFEAAVFPQAMYRFLRMPVVSYAIPALVAIGQTRHFHGPRTWLPVRLVRAAAVEPTMKVLGRMQPDSGGYLEATPLTSFVLMSLAATGRGDHDVARNCVRFLVDSVLPDGSWPIDTNLATWVTSLAMHALDHADTVLEEDSSQWCSESLIAWHRNCQHRERHPFTGTDPGGWGWSDLSGAVPDGDDTPAALLALAAARQRPAGQLQRASLGKAFTDARRWLLGLQNRDGGWPTFCRGWGKLPFDRSSVDLTAHAIRALTATAGDELDPAAERAIRRGYRFLAAEQTSEGAWMPLWFGNQDEAQEDNPWYGTARVLLALAEAPPGEGTEAWTRRIAAACRYLLEHRNADGGWGGGPSLTDWLRRQNLADRDEDDLVIRSSIEETAVVTEALAAVLLAAQRNLWDLGRFSAATPTERGEADKMEAALRAAVLRGAGFLQQVIRSGRHHEPWPIGFYFAKLWYHESLYPAVFATAALSRVLKLLRCNAATSILPAHPLN